MSRKTGPNHAGSPASRASTTRRGMCVRCRVNERLSQMTGCLCSACEDAIEGMTQVELDNDYAAHSKEATR